MPGKFTSRVKISHAESRARILTGACALARDAMDAMAKMAHAESADPRVHKLLHPSRTSDGMKRPDWFPDWRGRACAIIASGPSAKVTPLELLRGQIPVLVINTSYQ